MGPGRWCRSSAALGGGSWSLCLAAGTFLLLPGFWFWAEAASPAGGGRETLVLVWFPYQGGPSDCWGSFRISGCRISSDRSEYQQADAVFLRHKEVVNSSRKSLPRDPRPPAQKWIWFQIQSPTTTRRLMDYEGIYNLTFSYREDSNITLPFGYLVPNVLLDQVPQAAGAVPLDVSSGPRPGLVSWVVSHWSDKLERVRIYKLLKKHVQVDIFGEAGKALPSGKDSVVELLRGYRFYLAFENAQHTDYITEKLWNAVLGGAIPVVLGPSRKNYERFLPPEAFIHVDDFPTVQGLARYLLKVKDSPALIQAHLSWRSRYSVLRPIKWAEFYCMACRVVQLRKGKTDLVQNLEAWHFF